MLAAVRMSVIHPACLLVFRASWKRYTRIAVFRYWSLREDCVCGRRCVGRACPGQVTDANPEFLQQEWVLGNVTSLW